MKKRGLFLIFWMFPLLAYSWHNSNGLEQEKTVFFLTLPKSGTHLLKKMLCMLIGEGELYFTNIDKSPYDPPAIPKSRSFIFNHVYPGFSLYKEPNPDKYIKVLLIRDPRDIVVSFFYMLKDHGWRGDSTPDELLTEFRSGTVEEMISKTITFPDEYLGMRVFFEEALEWMKDPNVFVLRFEDIVGPEGGGDRMVQEETFRALLDHLGIYSSEEEIRYILDHAFGPSVITGAGYEKREVEFWPKYFNLMNGSTFRKGEIGAWAQHFTDDHKVLFKLVMGEALIQMGYEQDYNW